MQRRAQHGVDDFVGVAILRQVRAQQLDVAEDDREDVVEIVRDAAGELSDGFHLLRSKERLARLLDRFLRAPQLGDVVRDAEEAENPAAPIAIHAFRHQIGLPVGLAGRHAFEYVRIPRFEDLPVVLDELPRGLFRIQLEIVLADDFVRRFSEEARGRFVDEDVPAFEILDEDGVGRRLHHRLENLKAVRNRHRPITLSPGAFAGQTPIRCFRDGAVHPRFSDWFASCPAPDLRGATTEPASSACGSRRRRTVRTNAAARRAARRHRRIDAGEARTPRAADAPAPVPPATADPPTRRAGHAVPV